MSLRYEPASVTTTQRVWVWHQVRMGRMREHHTKIESGGWHASFFTDQQGVMEKVRQLFKFPVFLKLTLSLHGS